MLTHENFTKYHVLHKQVFFLQAPELHAQLHAQMRAQAEEGEVCHCACTSICAVCLAKVHHTCLLLVHTALVGNVKQPS